MTPRPSDGEVLAVSELVTLWCGGLAPRHGDDVLQGELWRGNSRMTKYPCQQLVSFCPIVLVEAICCNIVSLGYGDLFPHVHC